MVQFTYLAKTWKQLTQQPQDREAALRELAAKLNSKVIGLHYTAGDYDGFAIVEVPDDETIKALVFAVVSAGHVRQTKTTRLYSMEEVLKSLNRAKGLGYTGPKAPKEK